MMPLMNKDGFSLMEVLLVIILVGLVLAVIAPRAYRASIDAKYGLLRQNCTELARWANEWAERELDNQPETAASNLEDYVRTLAIMDNVVWVGQQTGTNWQAGTGLVTDRGGLGVSQAPSTSVLHIMPQDQQLKNPFNGLSMFSSVNVPNLTNPAVPGAAGCSFAADPGGSNFRYFALLFQGTDATGTTDFYAGQSAGSLDGLRNGVFVNRLLKTNN
jgi:prepilin-type N-terminal cleavage/methylation domain-containing protein